MTKCARVLTFDVECVGVRRVYYDVVGDVCVQCHLVVLGRRVDGDATRIVCEVVVSDRQQLGILYVEVDDADRRVVQHADAATLDVVGFKRYTRVGLADVLEYEATSFVPRHRVVSDSLQLTSA